MDRGDRKPAPAIEWETPGGQRVGHMVKRVTSRIVVEKPNIGGTDGGADNVVRSKNPGRIAGDKPTALKRI